MKSMLTGLFLFSLLFFHNLSHPVLGPASDSCDHLPFLFQHKLDDEMEILKKEPCITISLGENCFPAIHASEHKVRIRSFPFDWNITPAQSLYDIFYNDFDGFLDLKNLVINGNAVLNKRYNFKFMHDFDVKDWYDGPQGLTPKDKIGEEDYKKICSYYERRIARLYSVFNLNVPLYLFRRVITANEASNLYVLLKTKFPQSNFTLVCIQDEKWESPKVWENRPGIIYIKMAHAVDGTYKSGQRRPEWTQIFKSLGLIKS